MCGCKICVIICSIQAPLNCYRLDHLKISREQARDKSGWIARLGLYATEKDNIYANDFYPNNQHMHLKPIYALLAVQCKPVYEFSVPHLRIFPLTMKYVTKVLYTPRINGN